MAIPRVETQLPAYMQLVDHLAAQVQRGTLTGWAAFAPLVRAFFTPARLAEVEHVVPGWGEMARHAKQQTLIHVTSVLVALRLLPEYQQATALQQAVMDWMVLFHDVAKIPRPGQHDFVHGFRSAAITGRALANVGFPVTDAYAPSIDEWATLTHHAVVYRADLDETIQDNRQLPAILAGIDRLFGASTPAGWIVKGVLLHMSIANDPDYPTLAPLTDDEIQQIIDTAFLPLLKMMMLVDTDGWDLFDPVTHQRHRQQTLDVFERIGMLIGV